MKRRRRSTYLNTEDDQLYRGDSIVPGRNRRGIGAILPEDADDLAYDDYDWYDDPDVFGSGRGASGRRRAAGRRNTDRDDSGRGPYLFISLAFGFLFLLLMINLVKFNVADKDDVLNNPYNRRNNTRMEYTIRGEIRSVDGKTLAKTVVYDNDYNSDERVYPYYNLYAHVVGYSTYGKTGIESAADYELMTAHNNIIDQVINSFKKQRNPGDTVVTTLDSRIQEAAYYAMDNYRGAVVAMDPRTGAVLAMVAQPNFDPNTISAIWDDMISDPNNSQLLNRATQGKYPPGSTFKIVTALAYYRKYGTLNGFQFDCTGELEVGNSTVHCYNGSIHGNESFYSAFAHSCNTAFASIGIDLGYGPITSTAKDLLFGKRPPCEISASKTSWQLTRESELEELVQTSFGQGRTLTTPYHMALICSAIANRGILMKPYLIDHIENNAGSLIKRTSPSRSQKLMSEDEAAVLKDLMKDVVEYGTASALSGRSYQVFGKTGSAEYTRSDGSMGTHSWFVGFSGYEEPDLVVVVLAENGGAGSSTAVPIASEVMRAYYGQ